MIRNKCTLLLLLFFLLSACVNNVIKKPVAVVDAESYTSEGLKAYSEAKWYRAQLSFIKALSFYQGIDDQQGILVSKINLAEVALAMNDSNKFEQHIADAKIIANKTSQIDAQSRIALLYSEHALKHKQLVKVKTLLQPLLPEFDGEILNQKVSYLELVAITHRTKVAFLENHQTTLWTRRYANALKSSEVKETSFKSRLLRFQAGLFEQQGDIASAESSLLQALAAYKKELMRSGIAATLSELGQFYMKQQRWQEAKEYFNRALVVYRYIKDSEKLILIGAHVDKVRSKLDVLSAN